MNIQGPSNIHGTQGIKGPHNNNRPAESKSTSSKSSLPDEVKISSAGEAASLAAESGEVRSELVARVRSEIAAGTYETPDKLDAALDGLLNELG